MDIFSLRNFVGACGGIAGLYVSSRAYHHWYGELPEGGGKSWPNVEARNADMLYSHIAMIAAPFAGAYLGATLGGSVIKPIKDATFAMITGIFRRSV